MKDQKDPAMDQKDPTMDQKDPTKDRKDPATDQKEINKLLTVPIFLVRNPLDSEPATNL
jgi:hypothetical protein